MREGLKKLLLPYLFASIFSCALVFANDSVQSNNTDAGNSNTTSNVTENGTNVNNDTTTDNDAKSDNDTNTKQIIKTDDSLNHDNNAITDNNDSTTEKPKYKTNDTVDSENALSKSNETVGKEETTKVPDNNENEPHNEEAEVPTEKDASVIQATKFPLRPTQPRPTTTPKPPCLTDDGPVIGEPCQFPFIYEGREHSHCTKQEWDKLWCSTATDAEGHFIDGKWGECGKDCIGQLNNL